MAGEHEQHPSEVEVGGIVFSLREIMSAHQWMASQPLRETVPGYYEDVGWDGERLSIVTGDLFVSIVNSQRGLMEDGAELLEPQDTIFVQGKVEIDESGEFVATYERVKGAKFVKNPPNPYR